MSYPSDSRDSSRVPTPPPLHVYLCFVDLSKAYDSVDLIGLVAILGTPPAGAHHSGALHWNRVPCENRKWRIERPPGEDRGEAGLCVVSTVVQLCHEQDSEVSN